MERIRHKNIEYVVASLSELDEDLRCDAEYFLGIGLNDKPFRLGRGATVFSQYGTSKELNEEGQGFPVLRLNEFNDLFLGQPAKNTNLISEKIYNSLQIKKNDVLISRTNGNPKLVGKAAVSMRDENFGFASYLFRVRTDEKFITPEVLTCYLSSLFGRGEIEKFSMISNQANFSPAKFRKIKIPVIPHSIQKIITENFKEAYKLNLKSNQLYNDAERILLSELGLENWKPKTQKFKLRNIEFEIEYSFSTVSLFDVLKNDRIDSDFWDYKYLELEKLLSKQKNVAIGNTSYFDLITGIYSNQYTLDTGKYYIRSTDISERLLIDEKSLFRTPNKYSEKFEVKEGDILTSRVGSIGTVGYVTEEYNGSIISDNTLRIRINPLQKDLLPLYSAFYLFFVGVHFMKRLSRGSVQQRLNQTTLKSINIPIVEIIVQRKIQKLLNDSFAAKRKTKQLLETSKRAIEIFIEQDEKAALKYIQTNIK